jgi:hypothetical protein
MDYFDDEVKKKFYDSQFNGREVSGSDKNERYLYRSIRMLKEFMLMGEIQGTFIISRKEPLFFDSAMGLTKKSVFPKNILSTGSVSRVKFAF